MKLRTAKIWRNGLLGISSAAIAIAASRFFLMGEGLTAGNLSRPTAMLLAIGILFGPYLAIQPWLATFLFNAISELGPYYQTRIRGGVVSALAIEEYTNR